MLRKAGVSYQLVNIDTIDGGVSSLTKYPLLVIGKNSYSEAEAIFRNQLPVEGTVHEGLNILCLEQRNRYVMGLKLENLNARQAFIRAKDSLLFKQSSDNDFTHWRGESKLLPPYPEWSDTADWRSRTGQQTRPGEIHLDKGAIGIGRTRGW